MVLSKIRFGPATAEFEAPTRYPDGSPLTFPELLAQSRQAFGGRVAFQQKVRGDWQRWTFRDISDESYRLAAGLIAAGLRPGDRVAIIGENSLQWVCAYYAIVIARGTAVPMYYELKPAEIAEMVGRSTPRFAFISAKVLSRFQQPLESIAMTVVMGDSAGEPHRDGLARIVAYADVAAMATDESRATLAATTVEPDDLASLIFTSGTTGGMKGVMLTHRNFMADTRSARRSIAFTDRDRLIMVLPLHHAFPFLVAMCAGPAVGATVTLENDLRRVRDRMAEVKPTIFLGVPQLFEVMYRNILSGIEAQGRMETFQKGLRIVEATKQRTGINIGRIVFRELHKRLGASLRFCISGGAALNPQVARNFARLGIPILQGWGLTEAAPVLAVQRWSPRRFYMSNYYEERFGTVGQAIDGVAVSLIDIPEKELYVHLHGEGELIARGENITPGYWQSDEATAAAKLGEWLRTGDVGRIDDEGNIWITGRSKFVIVLDSGEKVHPDELEEKIERSPCIADVAVIGKNVRGRTQAWAVVYPNYEEVARRLGDGMTVQAVRDLIKTEIDAQERDVASYKRTSNFILSDAPLPRTKPLRKIARAQIADTYEFAIERWRDSWPAYVDASAPAGSADGDDAEPATA
ncbi:MAG TPA: AMP-binding protein [Dehalococcoidia bacterium]|nr:AMP-binding protein [Dehalococcoidia bacterium]